MDGKLAGRGDKGGGGIAGVGGKDDTEVGKDVYLFTNGSKMFVSWVGDAD